ncbi:hypothetical protein PHYPSEUDO_003112 [Phytophthora pseudosyringae]|uniref:Uncharacterized protein n=1 Tax=Phytophthora pseudosyringae TaxID=221518 RepID=A0A8T1WEU1_9STRA|nr:hypothetical protein PHYPSEUDO_003112 [Phytophthora pseudosyringae]
MNYDGLPFRMSTTISRAEDELNDLQPRYSQELGERRQTAMDRGGGQRFQDESDVAHEWQDEGESPVYTRVQSLRNSEEDKELGSTDDPCTDNGESRGSSLETQQWSDAEGNDPSSTRTAELSAGDQAEVPCRVAWCEHAGKRYGLCWAHGGGTSFAWSFGGDKGASLTNGCARVVGVLVKKCCARNCAKMALATGEFCSIHEREISASTF